MKYLVSKIVNFLIEQDVICDEADVQDFYRYGIEISISSFLNIFLVLLVGILIHHIVESVVFLALFILIRSFTGGYHADTYFRCNLLMCTSFILTVFVNIITSGKLVLHIAIALVIFTEIIILILGPIENKNKPIKKNDKIKFKIKGVILTLIINCFGITIYENYVGTMIIYTSLLIAILMVAAVIKEKRGDLYEKA